MMNSIEIVFHTSGCRPGEPRWSQAGVEISQVLGISSKLSVFAMFGDVQSNYPL